MRVRQIGTLVFDADTNIVVDATNQDAPGIGFNINTLSDPQPFAVEIAFRRATRQQALNAVNKFARELYSYAQRRQDDVRALAGGVRVVVEDANGGTSLRSYLRDSSVNLLSIEATATGVVARVRVTGTLVNPIIDYWWSPPTYIPFIPPYGRHLVSLTSTSDEYLYKCSFSCEVYNMSGLYNVLFAVEERESATGTSRITAISPASVSGGITTQSWNAGWATLTRASFSSTTSGTITYNLAPSVPADVYRLFIEIFCPTTPPMNARYIISWDGQPQIAETITGDRSWYTPALITPDVLTIPVTLEVQNVPIGTLVMPLILIPTDGVYVWNIITPPTMSLFQVFSPQYIPFRTFRTNPPGTIYGAPEFIISRYAALFFGATSQSLANSYATLYIYPTRIEPAAFA